MSVTALRRLQAPLENGAILAVPPLAETARLLADNRHRFSQPRPDLLGRSWSEIRKQAQREALAAAKEYLTQAGEPLPISNEASFFVAGHQPDLFHPGVWIKNFALNGLAKSYGSTPLNLIVDSDAAKTTSIRVPALTDAATFRAGSVSAGSEPPGAHASGSEFGDKQIDPDRVKLLTIPIDRWTREIPYEELRVADEATLANVEDQVMSIVQAWGFTSMFGSFWQTVLRQGQRTDILGERLAAARRSLERKWNCHNWELPVSRLCQTPTFAWFACHLLSNLSRFQVIYNNTVRAYRERYGLRSRSHPVPELAAKNGWLETPFWAWRANQPRRRPLLARQAGAAIELRLENETLGELPENESDQTVAAWQELEASGIKIRSRALMTTLFARLFLGDLFIHGIGGGKYDELTNEIIRRFYDLEPPAYMILSGTLHLPLPIFPIRPEDCRRLARALRDLHWNPQRHLDEKLQRQRGEQGEGDLAILKAELIARQADDLVQRRQRFQMLRELTEKLRPLVSDRERVLKEGLTQCQRKVQANRILQSREYAFCLYPEETLRPFCTQSLDKSVVSSP